MSKSLRLHPQAPTDRGGAMKNEKANQYNEIITGSSILLLLLLWAPLSPWQEILQLTQRGGQMENRFAYLFICVGFNRIRSFHWLWTRKVSISFSCNHTQTHILALNLKKLFPVIKTCTMICHIVCVHRTVLCGFKSNFFFWPQLYKDVNFLWINTMVGTSRKFADFRRKWSMSIQTATLVTTKTDSFEEVIFFISHRHVSWATLHMANLETQWGKGSKPWASSQHASRETAARPRLWNLAGQCLIYKSQFVLGESLCSTSPDISDFTGF